MSKPAKYFTGLGTSLRLPPHLVLQPRPGVHHCHELQLHRSRERPGLEQPPPPQQPGVGVTGHRFRRAGRAPTQHQTLIRSNIRIPTSARPLAESHTPQNVTKWLKKPQNGPKKCPKAGNKINKNAESALKWTKKGQTHFPEQHGPSRNATQNSTKKKRRQRQFHAFLGVQLKEKKTAR